MATSIRHARARSVGCARVGAMTRRPFFDLHVAAHTALVVDRRFRNAGTGTDLFASSLRLYDELGIERVLLMAGNARPWDDPRWPFQSPWSSCRDDRMERKRRPPSSRRTGRLPRDARFARTADGRVLCGRRTLSQRSCSKCDRRRGIHEPQSRTDGVQHWARARWAGTRNSGVRCKCGRDASYSVRKRRTSRRLLSVSQSRVRLHRAATQLGWSKWQVAYPVGATMLRYRNFGFRHEKPYSRYVRLDLASKVRPPGALP